MEKPKTNPKRLVILIAIAGGIYFIGKACGLITEKPPRPQSTTRSAPRCQTAEANIRDNLTLYRDAKCTDAIGKISGIGRTPSGEALVFIIEADGTEQQVARRSTKDWFVIN